MRLCEYSTLNRARLRCIFPGQLTLGFQNVDARAKGIYAEKIQKLVFRWEKCFLQMEIILKNKANGEMYVFASLFNLLKVKIFFMHSSKLNNSV